MAGGSAFDEHALSMIRRAYAKQMLALAGVESDPGLEDALATVPREGFLGAPPWLRLTPFGDYRVLPSCDPVLVYQDINLALSPERGVNNGSPSLHARWLHRAGLKRGDRVAHVGAGAGYYSALMAHVVGDEGHVLAVELDPALAESASSNLARLTNVTVVQGDGAEWPRERVDCVYVNFLVQHPAPAWVEHLVPGGRLIFPLGVPRPSRGGGTHTLHGAGLRIERLEQGFAAEWLGPAYFVYAEGLLAEPHAESAALKTAFENGGIEFIRSLRWRRPATPGRCWYIGAGWSLSYDEAV